jgi:hypothetical protein
MNTWENYGDVNPLEHGGLFVRRSEDDTMEFDVVHIHPDADSEKIFYADGLVSLRDDWIDWDAVGKYNGGSGTYAENAKDAFIYYGAENFGGNGVFITLGEVKERLEAKGIKVEE